MGLGPGIRDFTWSQTKEDDHTHQLTASNPSNAISVSGDTGPASVPHTHRISGGTLSGGDHSHSGMSATVSLSPSQVVTSVSVNGTKSVAKRDEDISVVDSIRSTSSALRGSVSFGSSGSHSHPIVTIPTTTSSESATHTHTVTASGNNSISVTGNTTSGGTHSHTFGFKYSELKDISNQNTKTASETTVKNRQMRIWRRVA
jgi:hypothetical protein